MRRLLLWLNVRAIEANRRSAERHVAAHRLAERRANERCERRQDGER